jgi:hypothetical protein
VEFGSRQYNFGIFCIFFLVKKRVSVTKEALVVKIPFNLTVKSDNLFELKF